MSRFFLSITKKHCLISLMLLVVTILPSCGYIRELPVNNSGDGAIIFITILNKKEGMGRDFMVIENVDTKEQIVSSPVNKPAHNFCFPNTPPGRYQVVSAEFCRQIGNVLYSYKNNSQELKDYFGVFSVRPGEKVYLGDYVFYDANTKTNLFFHKVELKLSFNDKQEVPKGILEMVEKSDWKDGEFKMLSPNKKIFDFY